LHTTLREENYHFPDVSLVAGETEHRRHLSARETFVYGLYVRFATTNMTRRLKWSAAGSTLSTVSSAPSMRWRRFARIAIAGLSGTALKLMDKFSAASTARAKAAKTQLRDRV
jgi:hypothetical protein